MEMNFCRRCGATLALVQNHIYKCKGGHTLYANASPAVAIFLINEKDEVLTTLRAIDPGKGALDVPGGFVDGAETFEHAIAREVEEEIGINVDDYSVPQYIKSVIDPYSLNRETIDVLSVYFWARLESDLSFTPQDDVSEIHFVRLQELDPEKFFFSGAHEALKRLKQLLS